MSVNWPNFFQTTLPLDFMQLSHHLSKIEYLTFKDFFTYYLSFRRIVEKKLPPFEKLKFFSSDVEVERAAESPVVKKHLIELLKAPAGQGMCVKGNILFNHVADEGSVVSLISGLDPYFAARVSSDWLVQVAEECSALFILEKKAGTDLETGLLNASQFYIHLEHLLKSSKLSVIFVEAYPYARSADEDQRHIAGIVRSLEACVAGLVPVYYLGSHVYGLIFNFDNTERLKKLAEKIIGWLRRDGFRRVHVGTGGSSGGIGESQQPQTASSLSDNLRAALQAARKKGPYALCEYEQLLHPETHPLCKPSKSLISKLRRMWSSHDSFSLVQIQLADKNRLPSMENYFADESILLHGSNIYIIKPGTSPEKALEWVTGRLKRSQPGDRLVGVACYPHGKFSKSSAPFNCRKAILHASFYGQNGAAVFNSLSLNVSGDIYYAEGNLRAAIKEYRNGLSFDQENINLLNSLGVAYADIGRQKDAENCFTRVVEYDSRNFMALFNLGLGAELGGRINKAIHFYERCETGSSPLPEVSLDLQYRLGRLYSLGDRHKEAVGLLVPWYKNEENGRAKGKALAFLGKSYFALGDYDRAAGYLQKALRFDEFDAASIGLLGYIYLLKNEGPEIALSMCRKSVDLEPDNLQLRVYLAHTEISCGKHEQSRITVKRCLLRKETRPEACFLICMSYLGEKQIGRAKFWLRKLNADKSLDNRFLEKVKKINEEINGI